MKELAQKILIKDFSATIWPESYSAQSKIIKKIAQKSEVERLTAHLLRHTFGTN
ncbi:MAG: phage integrase family protein [Bacteroidetes bacterium]|nr:phage integrase family protein [Bacteroidota bacterium]